MKYTYSTTNIDLIMMNYGGGRICMTAQSQTIWAKLKIEASYFNYIVEVSFDFYV